MNGVIVSLVLIYAIMEAYHGNSTKLFALMKQDAPAAFKWVLAVVVLLWIRDRLEGGPKQVYTGFLVLALIGAAVSQNALPNMQKSITSFKQATGL